MNDKLKFSAFILLAVSQFFSILGSSITSFTISTHIFQTTGKVTPLVISLLFAVLPYLILGPFLGNLCDLWNKKYIVIISDTMCAIFAAILFFLLIYNTLYIHILYIIVFLSAIFNMANSIAFQSAVPILVTEDKLKQSNGITQLIDSASSLIAPIVAGFLYITVGFSKVVSIEIITFLIALPIILHIPSSLFSVPQSESKQEYSLSPKVAFSNSIEGFMFIKQHLGLVLFLAIFALDNMFSQISSTYITPIILDLGDAGWLGIVEAISGGGMLIGGLIASIQVNKRDSYIHTVFIFQLLCALSQIFLGLQRNLILIILVRGLYCLMVPIINTCAITLWQIKTPNYLQGRVYSARQMIVRALTPIAYLLAGPLADNFTPWILRKMKPFEESIVASNYQFAIIFSGCMLVICILFFYSNKELRNIDNIPST